ncbi:MAG: hypothetical protein LLG37_10405, partial [Spirochaetia bacterium]|nr:hypothetical protein [Spirochaetia bacterium]
ECPCCAGRGRVFNEETVCTNNLKKIKYECRKTTGRKVTVMMPEAQKKLLEKCYRERIKQYEKQYNKTIVIKAGEIRKEAGK